MSSITAERTTTSDALEILTLSEAATYLRVPEEVLRQMASEQAVPARRIGTEWRFLKSALQEWLGRGTRAELLLAELEHRLMLQAATEANSKAKIGSKERLLSLAGKWKDDPTLDEMLQEIYKQRGRPMTEADE